MAAALLALLLLALSTGVLPLPLPLQLALLLMLVATGLLLLRRERWNGRRQWALVLALALAWSWGLQGRPAPGAQDPSQLLRADGRAVVVTLRGQLLADPQPLGEGEGCRLPLQLSGGRTELLFRPCPALRQDWRLEASGTLIRPKAAPHPLLTGSAERLARQGIWSQLQVESWQLLSQPATPLVDLRRRMATALVQSGGPEAGGVLAALVLGSAVVPVPLAVRDAFRAAGLSHALAASGFHLTVLLGAVMAFSRLGGRPLRWGLALGAMVLFLLLAGPQPSVVRAVAMGALAFLVQESGRRVRPLGVLLLCVLLILLAAPAWLLDVGFQLSVAATAGLMLMAGPLQRTLEGRLPHWLAGATAVPLAASLATLPLQLLHFGALPLYAVPANMAAAPLLTPLTLGAMAAAVVAVLLPALLPLLVLPLAWLAQALTAVAAVTAGLPMAQWQTGRPQPLLVLCLAFALGLGLLPGLGRRWRRAAPLLLALAVALHLGQLTGDALLLVHQPGAGAGRDLLLARHHGRAALIASHADAISCRQASQLTAALGVSRADWALLLDPLPAADASCWQRQAGLVLANGHGGPPLQLGQQLASPGLAATALSADSHALALEVGGRPWLLLPDRQALLAWQGGAVAEFSASTPPGLWLGFRPRPREAAWLRSRSLAQVWLSAGTLVPASPHHWRVTGESGFLHTAH